CGSTFDTYAHLLDSYGTEVAGNDDSPTCGIQSDIEFSGLPAGTYYVVVEGKGYATGDFYINLSSLTSIVGSSPGANMSNAIDAGVLSPGVPFSDTRS